MRTTIVNGGGNIISKKMGNESVWTHWLKTKPEVTYPYARKQVKSLDWSLFGPWLIIWTWSLYRGWWNSSKSIIKSWKLDQIQIYNTSNITTGKDSQVDSITWFNWEPQGVRSPLKIYQTRKKGAESEGGRHIHTHTHTQRRIQGEATTSILKSKN